MSDEEKIKTSKVEKDDPNPNDREGFIIVDRDYSQGFFTKFSETFPKKMEQHNVSIGEWAHTISSLNEFFKEAEELSLITFMEGCLGCLSLFAIFLCYESRYKKIMRQMLDFIEEENKAIYRQRGLEILNPLANGLLELEIKLLSNTDHIV